MPRLAFATVALAAIAVAVSSTPSFAGGQAKRYYGGSNLHHRFISKHQKGRYRPSNSSQYRKVVVSKPVRVCYHPEFRLAYVQPGDTWATLCQRVYGRTDVWTKVVAYNNMAPTAVLEAGQQIRLPSVYSHGQVVASTAPIQPAPVQPAPVVATPPQPTPAIAPEVIAQPQLATPPAAAPVAPPIAASVQPSNPTPAPQIPTFNTGSSLVLDGNDFGTTAGEVKLMVGPLALPLEVNAWSASEVTIQLPELPMTATADARLVVINADGKLVNESNLRLAPQTARLTIGN